MLTYEIRIRPSVVGYVSSLSRRVRLSEPTRYVEVRSYWRATERWAIATARGKQRRYEKGQRRMQKRVEKERVVTS